MSVDNAARIIARELREAGAGFTVEGYEHATRRFRELVPSLGGLSLKTVAGQVNATAGRDSR